ncbi:MAG: response regulator [Sphingobium sp.]
MLFGRDKADDTKSRSRIRRVLVVEDEPLIAFDNEHALEAAGYSVAATVEDYDHAAAVIDAGGIDLLVADVALHGQKTGIDLAAYALDLGLPVLFVTGSCPAQARHLAIGCLAKPYASRDLVLAIRAVDAVLRGRAPRRMPPGLTLFADPA